MLDANEPVNTVFSGISPLVVDGVSDEEGLIRVRVRTPGGPVARPNLWCRDRNYATVLIDAETRERIGIRTTKRPRPGCRCTPGRARRRTQEDPRAGGGARHPAQGRPVFRRGGVPVHRCEFVADQQRPYGVERLCQVLGIARSSFSRQLRPAPDRAARQAADAEATARIRTVHAPSDDTHDVPRVTAGLRDQGDVVNHEKVARLMDAAGIAEPRLRRKQRTTIAAPAAPKAYDLVGRDFTADEPNRTYVGDITYLPAARPEVTLCHGNPSSCQVAAQVKA
ncbi:IS3 family transposase [Kitasatospora sp. NPDC088346]|uniref:IS3 family transposase n=1 Tax=Kitasatospora sp. NPDC088346 TaxID=3364073 RepID=UPI00382ED46F